MAIALFSISAFAQTGVIKANGETVQAYKALAAGLGFGMDFAIVLDPKAADTPEGKNTYYWGGAFGTWFWIDPTNDVIVVGMIQNTNGSQTNSGTPQVRPLSRRLVYQALVDPRK